MQSWVYPTSIEQQYEEEKCQETFPIMNLGQQGKYFEPTIEIQ